VDEYAFGALRLGVQAVVYAYEAGLASPKRY
jgi:hypothetical protein